MKPINLFTVHIVRRPSDLLAVAAEHAGEVMLDLVHSGERERHPEPTPWGVVVTGIGRPHKGEARHKDLPLFLQLPRNTPSKLLRNARNTLWAKVDWEERRSDAQLARTFVMPMPYFLGLAAQQELAERFCQQAFVERGMIADWSLSRHDARHQQDVKQSELFGHRAPDGAHKLSVLTTLRAYSRGKFGNKERAWNDREMFREWRLAWCSLLSAAIEAAPADACTPAARAAWLAQCRDYMARDAGEAQAESAAEPVQAQEQAPAPAAPKIRRL
jgi:hypothetical protein